MKYLFFTLSCSALVFGQANMPAPTSANQVVAKVGERSITADEMRKLMATLPPEVLKALGQDPKRALEMVFMIDHLAKEGEKEKLAETSPVKEKLALDRQQILAQTIVERFQKQIQVTDEEVKQRYEKDKDKYDQAKIRAIHVSYIDPGTIAAQVNMSNPSDPKVAADLSKKRTEADAKARAEEVLQKARAGSDFAELAKQYSDDQTSAVKGGEYGVIRRGDNLPNEIKDPVFARKAGEMTDLIKQPNGFLIIKVDERSQQPLSAVQAQILQTIKTDRYNNWMQSLQKQFAVTVENPAFFGINPPPAPPKLPAPPSK